MWPTTFLKTFWTTLTQPRVYEHFIDARWSWLGRYLITAIFLLGVFQSLLFSAQIVPAVKSETTRTLSQLVESFPPATVITWDKQLLHVTPPEEATSPLDSSQLETMLRNYPETPSQSILISTQPGYEFSPSSLENLIIVTNKSLFIQMPNQQWLEYQLPTLPGFDQEFTYTKEQLIQFIPEWQSYLNLWFFVATIVYFVLSPFLVTLMLVVKAFLEIIFAVVIFKLLRLRLSTTQLIKLSTPIVVIAQVIELISSTLTQTNLNIFSISYWILLCYLYLNLRYQSNPG